MSLRAAGGIGDPYLNRCNTPVQGVGSPNVYNEQVCTSRIGDVTIPYQEIVPCPKCCKTHVGPVLVGSPKVFVNKIAALRIGDMEKGITGNVPLIAGATTVFMA